MHLMRILALATGVACAGLSSVRGEGGDALHRPLPEAITSFGAATLDGKLYVYSGHSETTASTGPESLSKSFRRLDLEDPDAAWEELAMHEPAQSTALVVHDGALYRVGGLAFDRDEKGESLFRSTPYFARFDIAANAWTELAPLPEPRSSLDAAVVGDCLYVVGGWNLQGESSTDAPWHDDLLKFDFKNPEAGWQSIPEPACGAVRALAVASHDGKLFVLGGMREEGGITEEVHLFDPATGAWAKGPSLIRDSAMAGFAISAFGAGGKLYYTGGSGVVFRLSDDGSKWEVADRLFFPRMFHRVVPRSDRALVALGGIAGGERTTTVETVDVADQTGPKFVAWSVPFDGQVRQGQNVVVVGSKLYAFGGNVSREPHDFSEAAFSAEAYRFDLGARTVEKLPDLPQPMQSGAAFFRRQTSEHRLLCVVGGLGFRNGSYGNLDEIVTFDPATTTWATAQATLPRPRSMFSALSHGDAVWMFGGSETDGDERKLATSVLHWDGDGASPVGALPDVSIPTPRRSFGGALLDGKYYLVGGLTEKSGIADSVDVFDVESRAWSSIASPTTARVFPSLATVGGKLYLFGGFARVEGHFAPASSLEVYDPAAGAWSVAAEELPFDASGMNLFAMGERLLFYGIDDESDGVANFAIYDPNPLAEPKLVDGPFGSMARAAGEGGSEEFVAFLMRRDANKDERLSREEIGRRLQSFFEKADTNADGFLTREEATAAAKERESRTENSRND